MKNVVVEFDKSKGQAKAREYFMEICGYHLNENTNQKRIDDSLRTLNDIYEKIRINAIFSKYEGHCLKADKLICDDVTFHCRALSQVPGQDVLNIYAYLLSIGEIDTECERLLHRVYYDIWQTAYVDMGRDLLKEYIADSLTCPDFVISDTFGPGFFGMPASDTNKFFQILDADKIGLSIKSDGMMIPAKSYAGFFLVTTKEESLPPKDCENCASSRKTCSYCKAGRRRAEAS